MVTLTDRDTRALAKKGIAGQRNILVALSGTPIDGDLVRMACFMAKHSKGSVYVVHVLEVPRNLPLDAPMQDPEVDAILDRALEVAEEANYEVEAEVVQARDAGPGIVDEARDRDCSLILLGLVPRYRFGRFDMSRTIPYVLEHATCRVFVVREQGQTGAAPAR
ncbi:MAG TPA: universal stress protein [Chloroflexota bacterium]|nr:universal stress protein [Chloroflexota bacterium]